MSVYVNDDKPKIKKEKIKCNVCKNNKLCIRFENGNICKTCWKKENKDKKRNLWCMYCEICGHLTLEDDYKTCSECENVVGRCCGRLYHCQSTYCECKNCYNYKCNECDNILPKDRIYVSDSDVNSESVSLCETCKNKINENVEYEHFSLSEEK